MGIGFSNCEAARRLLEISQQLIRKSQVWDSCLQAMDERRWGRRDGRLIWGEPGAAAGGWMGAIWVFVSGDCSREED